MLTIPGGTHGGFTPEKRVHIFSVIREFLAKYEFFGSELRRLRPVPSASNPASWYFVRAKRERRFFAGALKMVRKLTNASGRLLRQCARLDQSRSDEYRLKII